VILPLQPRAWDERAMRMNAVNRDSYELLVIVGMRRGMNIDLNARSLQSEHGGVDVLQTACRT
jgi:hypothetical protein